MANRVLLGNRATGGYGLYVSRAGDDVTTTGNPLAFDSRSACTLLVHSYGQGIATNGNQINIGNSLNKQNQFEKVGSVNLLGSQSISLSISGIFSVSESMYCFDQIDTCLPT